LDLRSVIERDVQAEVSKAQASPDQLEQHIRSAFINGMVLVARLQTKLPDATTDEHGWCAMVEKSNTFEPNHPPTDDGRTRDSDRPVLR
jgi:hypothetical protein